MDTESDGLYFSTQFWNITADKIPKENFDRIIAHIAKDNNGAKKLREYLQQRYVKVAQYYTEY